MHHQQYQFYEIENQIFERFVCNKFDMVIRFDTICTKLSLHTL